MKKAILLIFLFGLSNQMFSEVTKAKTTSVAVSEKLDNGEWEEWGEWEDLSVLIVLNGDDDRLKIFSKAKSIFDIVLWKDQTTNSNGDQITLCKAVDEDGIEVIIKFVVIKDFDNQLYIYYNNFRIVYSYYIL